MNNLGSSAVNLQSGTERQLALRFLQRQPQMGVRILEQYPAGQVVELLQVLDTQLVTSLMSLMLPETISRLCQLVLAEQMAAWLSGLSVRRITLVIRYLKKPQQQTVLDALPLQTSAACRILLNYPQDTIGAWMSAQFAVLPLDINVSDALQRLQASGIILDSDAIPIVDAGQCLKGLIAYTDLLVEPSTQLNELLQSKFVHSDWPVLSARASLAAAQQHSGWRQYDTLPVLDREHRLVGMLKHVHLRDALERHTLQSENNEPVQPASVFTTVGRSYLQMLGASLGWLTDVSSSADAVAPRTARKT